MHLDSFITQAATATTPLLQGTAGKSSVSGRIIVTLRSKKTVHLIYLSLHLSIANLLILCQSCIGNSLWFLSYFWYAGSIFCKLYAWFAAFGYHLCSNVIVTIGKI